MLLVVVLVLLLLSSSGKAGSAVNKFMIIYGVQLNSKIIAWRTIEVPKIVWRTIEFPKKMYGEQLNCL